MSSIRTYPSRCTLDILNPRHAAIHIEDIAHGLARECRWANQTRSRIPVAYHSLTVAQRFPDDPHLALVALLHDGSEAYMRDMPGPIKQHLPDYKEIEHHLMDTIYDALCQRMPTREERELVHFMDQDCTQDEAALRDEELIFDENFLRHEFLNTYYTLRGKCAEVAAFKWAADVSAQALAALAREACEEGGAA